MMPWEIRVTDHLASRRDLSGDEICGAFGITDPVERVGLTAALTVFAEEYGIASGTLRPDDPLAVFTAPSAIRNPLVWFFDQAAIEDSTSELGFRLTQERIRRGLPRRPAVVPKTVGDYVAAWLEPSPPSRIR